MKIIKKMRKAKGFTLVELLIVIIIIGILAGMMMLATGAATDKAEATKIVSNMRNIKAAAIMYYADKNDWPNSTSDDAAVSEYLDQKTLLGDGGYSLVNDTTSTKVVFTYDESKNPEMTDGIAEKLSQIDVLSADDKASGGTAEMSVR